PPTSPPLLPLPYLDIRWVHAGAQYLDLLPTPITTASTAYKAFSEDESARIEERWNAMTVAEQRNTINQWGTEEGEGNHGKQKKAKEKEKKDIDKSSSGSAISAAASEHHAEDGGVPDAEIIKSGQEIPNVEEKEDEQKSYKDVMNKFREEYEDFELIAGVPVSQDSLFEVSLPTLSLHPVFWAHTGSRVPVLRGMWFVSDETRPCGWELGEEIERGYREIKPWQPSYKHELATATSLGPAAEEKLKYNLPARFGLGLGVIFEDEEKGRLVSSGTLTYLNRAFWSTLRSKTGTYVYRGYAAARASSSKEDSTSGNRSRSNSRRGSSSSVKSEKPEPRTTATPAKGSSLREGTRRSSNVSIVEAAVNGLQIGTEKGKDAVKEGAHEVKTGLEGIREDLKRVGERRRDGDHDQAVMEENMPITNSSPSDSPCTDLFLVVHGIGQQLAAQYESYNFVYAGNMLRQVLQKQSANPALASIIRDRRCQVLPLQWRTSLVLDQETTEEDREHGMDNRFTMADITMSKSIPVVRDLTNSVLYDIPLFMSQHRQKMIEAVCVQANKLYRLWLARNPGFERNGRVHIIGHSLGSALAAHILSNQPTKMPPLSDLPKQVIMKTRNRFLFNTSNFFLCGSPLGIFMHLDQAQLMPRKGRERTMHSPQDEALDRAGKFGCFAADSLYNIFYYTDPVAYQLNAVVDSKLASRRPPLAITSVTAPFYTSVSEGLSSISHYLPTYLGGGTPERKKPLRPGVIRLPSGLEMSGPNGRERLEGTRSERRFSALNPHGNVDFFLPSAGVSEYLDMITAHASYWTDPSFAAFLLAETFSTRLDLMRTGMGLAQQTLPEGVISIDPTPLVRFGDRNGQGIIELSHEIWAKTLFRPHFGAKDPSRGGASVGQASHGSQLSLSTCQTRAQILGSVIVLGVALPDLWIRD
ncbi:hypothetical protein P7C73_g3228, partial [Tremellales sp. Uapishka_1]